VVVDKIAFSLADYTLWGIKNVAVNFLQQRFANIDQFR